MQRFQARQFLPLLTLAFLAGDCRPAESPGCLASGDPACVVPAVCPRLTYTCTGGFTRGRQLTAADFARSPGLDAQAAIGDWVLENDQVIAVIDSINEPHGLAPTGGSLLDLAPRNGGGDHLNQVYQITGVLPRDAAHYDTLELRAETDRVALVARGRLDGDARVQVVTTYELRGCDRGVRIRTEVYNGGATVWTSFLGDGYFWGDRSLTGFAPDEGGGYRHRPLRLTDISGSWGRFPWVAASAHTELPSSYATLSCDRPMLEGVQDPTITAVGLPRTVLAPGDGLAFERMIFVAPGAGIGGAQSLATEAHARLHGTRTVDVRGRVVFPSGAPAGGDERIASVMIYEPARCPTDANAGACNRDDPEHVTPWTHVVPGTDGTFTAVLPADRTYRMRGWQLGRAVGDAVEFTPVAAAGSAFAIPDLRIREPARVVVQATDATTRMPMIAETILVPTGPTRRTDVEGTTFGYFEACAPYLGSPHGSSPACDRAVFRGDTGNISVLPGTYHVYVTAGLQYSLFRQTVTLTEGMATTVMASLRPIAGLMPMGSLSGDFHVHGGRSFDTAFPDRDRVLSFVASGVDVIAGTDHDASASYEEAVRDLAVQDRVRVLPGVEMTPLIPYLHPPGDMYPRVVGHIIAWPTRFDATRPRNGAPWDELMEPGAIFDLLRPMVGATGVIQLNHPNAHSKVGRDEGFVRMLRFDPRNPLPTTDDGTALGMLYRRPGGAMRNRNIDYDAQEVLNGPDLLLNLQYRATWFTFLNHGILRAGTANSDSHSLRANVLGYPRNIVLGTFDRARLDVPAFNTAVREGHMLGTNGPIVDARLVTPGMPPALPGVQVTRIVTGMQIEVSVRAPPWVPVSEVRVFVNGRRSNVMLSGAIAQPASPLDSVDGIQRWTGTIDVAPLLAGRDGWIVIEAGLPPPATTDRHCPSVDPNNEEGEDGLPDCADGNGDGRIDEEELQRPAEGDPRFHVDVVSPGMLPWGFSNPFIFDVDGNGYSPPGGTL